MMEELKVLIDMVAKLPAMALWVLVGFWAYKVLVIGSIYGLIRFIISKLHDYLTTPMRKSQEIRALVDGVCISSAVNPLMAQISRVIGKGLNTQSTYVHNASVNWLREAIDDKIAKDLEEGKNK